MEHSFLQSFIIDGIITIPIAVFGFFFFPDLPETTKAFYLKPHEREMALARLPPKNPDGHNIGLSLIKRVLLTSNLYAPLSTRRANLKSGS